MDHLAAQETIRSFVAERQRAKQRLVDGLRAAGTPEECTREIAKLVDLALARLRVEVRYTMEAHHS